MYYLCLCHFFFFKQKTAYEMRISDWSSDVCSSDLLCDQPASPQTHRTRIRMGKDVRWIAQTAPCRSAPSARVHHLDLCGVQPDSTGWYRWLVVAVADLRKGDRKSVVEGKSVSVRVDFGGCGIIQKQKTRQHI